jgi:hypothetical protein
MQRGIISRRMYIARCVCVCVCVCVCAIVDTGRRDTSSLLKGDEMYAYVRPLEPQTLGAASRKPGRLTISK